MPPDPTMPSVAKPPDGQCQGLRDLEKQGQADGYHGTHRSDHGKVGDDTPITYLYLNFETILPQPPPQQLAGIQITTAPDLRSLTSPLTWSRCRKSLLLALGCVSTFLTAYTAGAYSPPARLIASSFGTSQTVVLLGITTFCLGFSLAPMILAPVSEIWGRYPVFIAAGAVWVASQAGCALSPDLAAMLACRFLTGVGASVFSSVVGGVLADLWLKERRNTPMAIFSGAVLAGTGAGPLVTAGMVEIMERGGEGAAWRWAFWHQAISNGVLLLCLVFFFRETRASVLLSRRATRLNRWYEALEREGVYGLLVARPDPGFGADATPDPAAFVPRRIRWRVQADEERAALGSMMATSVLRPFYMLFTEPVVFFFSLWAAFAWAVLYLGFSVVSYLHADDFSAACRTYIAMMAGAVVATAVGIWQEQLLKYPQWRRQPSSLSSSSSVGPSTDEESDQDQSTRSPFWVFMRTRFPTDVPEARLYFACFTSLLLPIGLFMAFMAPSTSNGDNDNDNDNQGHQRDADRGTILAIGIGFATWGIYAVYLASFNYMADVYHVYASSALAANNFCRNVLGGSFPVIVPSMFGGLGVRGAGGLLGGVAAGLMLIPWVLVFFGARIRARSHMATMLQK